MEPRFRAWNWPHSENLVKELDLPKIVLENQPATEHLGNETATLIQSMDAKNWTDCVEATMHWLIKDKIQFVSIYLDEPGDTAEIYGPESEETAMAVKVIDDKVGQLVDGLEHAELWPHKLNLIVTSTPGFAALSPDHLIDLNDFVKSDFYMAIGESPVLNIHPLSKCK